MAKLGDPTDFSYRVNKVTKVIDGDTIDVIIDLGFDIMYKSRVRLFGIDTPESRTRDLVEKKFGLMSKEFLKEHLKEAEKIVMSHNSGNLILRANVLYDHDTGDLGLPEIWDEYVSEFYPEKYKEIENEEPEDIHKKRESIFEFIDDLDGKEYSRALLFLVNKVYDESLFYDWLIDSTKEQEGVTQKNIDAANK